MLAVDDRLSMTRFRSSLSRLGSIADSLSMTGCRRLAFAYRFRSLFDRSTSELPLFRRFGVPCGCLRICACSLTECCAVDRRYGSMTGFRSLTDDRLSLVVRRSFDRASAWLVTADADAVVGVVVARYCLLYCLL
jgi:hypothetical protein